MGAPARACLAARPVRAALEPGEQQSSCLHPAALAAPGHCWRLGRSARRAGPPESAGPRRRSSQPQLKRSHAGTLVWTCAAGRSLRLVVGAAVPALHTCKTGTGSETSQIKAIRLFTEKPSTLVSPTVLFVYMRYERKQPNTCFKEVTTGISCMLPVSYTKEFQKWWKRLRLPWATHPEHREARLAAACIPLCSKRMHAASPVHTSDE